jgi:hypothetical protein
MMMGGKGNAQKKEDIKGAENLQEKIFINGLNKGKRLIAHHKKLNYVTG